MVAYGIAMFFVSKANRVHGGEVACFLQMMGYAVLLMVLGFGRTELARVTRLSLVFGAAAAILLVIGTLIMFRAIAHTPEKTALISIVSEGWPLITAILIQLTGTPLRWQQWLGASFIAGGMTLVTLFRS